MTNITEYYLNFNERWHRCIFSQFYLLKKESGKVSYMTNITDNVTITITQLPNMRGISFLFNTIAAIVLASHRVHETPVWQWYNRNIRRLAAQDSAYNCVACVINCEYVFVRWKLGISQHHCL